MGRLPGIAGVRCDDDRVGVLGAEASHLTSGFGRAMRMRREQEPRRFQLSPGESQEWVRSADGEMWNESLFECELLSIEPGLQELGRREQFCRSRSSGRKGRLGAV